MNVQIGTAEFGLPGALMLCGWVGQEETIHPLNVGTRLLRSWRTNGDDEYDDITTATPTRR